MTHRSPSDAILVCEHTGSGEAWDSFVRRDPISTFCHLWGWRAVMGEVLGHGLHYRVARNRDDDVLGVLPLIEVKSRLFGHYLLSMPFLNDGGPLGSPEARESLVLDARALASRKGVDLLELRERRPSGVGMQVSHRKVTILLDLPNDPEALWMGLDAKVRSQVRRPRKEGMTFLSGPGQTEAFYEVFSRNMRDLGTPVLPFAFFDRLRSEFPGRVTFGTVRLGERPLAAGCGFIFRDEFEMTWASALREYNRMAPNMLLYWSFLEELTRRKVRVFNFGRCTPGGGTHRFKLQWGGREMPLPWAQWSPRGRAETPSPDRPLFRLATTAWSRLPLTVANRLGPLLARQLP